MTDATEPIVHEQPGVLITHTAVVVRKRRIPYDQIVRFDAGVRRPSRAAPGFMVSAGLMGFATATLGIITSEGAFNALRAFGCFGFCLIVVLVGAFWYGAIKNRFAVVLRLRTGQVNLMESRTEAEAAPLREALGHALATYGNVASTGATSSPR